MTPDQRKKFAADMRAIDEAAHQAARDFAATVAMASEVFAASRKNHMASLQALEARLIQANTAHANAKVQVRELAEGARKAKSDDYDASLAEHDKAWAKLLTENDGSTEWEDRAAAYLARHISDNWPAPAP